MTLVVARTFAESLHVVSDTKISLEQVLHDQPLEQGALKCIAISPTFSVAFANDKGIAETALAPLLVPNSLGLDEIREHLLHCHIASRAKADFLIATMKDGNCGIDRICSGQMECDLTVAWIGDGAAFNRYQSHNLTADSLEGTGQSDVQHIRRMDDAMQFVIDESSVQSVAGFRVHAAATLRRGFMYQPYVRGFGFQPVQNTTEPTSLLRTVGVAGGSYNYSFLVPTQPGVGAIAVYVFEGQIGVLYFPARTWDPIIVRNVSFNEFVEAVRVNVGIEITGFGFG